MKSVFRSCYVLLAAYIWLMSVVISAICASITVPLLAVSCQAVVQSVLICGSSLFSAAWANMLMSGLLLGLHANVACLVAIVVFGDDGARLKPLELSGGIWRMLQLLRLSLIAYVWAVVGAIPLSVSVLGTAAWGVGAKIPWQMLLVSVAAGTLIDLAAVMLCGRSRLLKSA